MWVVITSIAAAAAVIVGFLQWKTAQTELALDIRATRYAIYQDLRDAVSRFLIDLNFSNEVHGRFLDAQSRARFHFGAEVDQYLEQLRSDMIFGHTFDRFGPANPVGTVDEQVEQVARLNRINAFYSEIDRKFVPYMRLDQKMPIWRSRDCATKIKDRASGIIAKLPVLLRRKDG